MWKKPENERAEGEYISAPTQSGGSVTIQASESKGECAIIGPSISVKGEITGAEDLLIEGFVEGTINLKQNIVTVGKTGRVQANVYGRTVHIEGEVIGDCFGTEQVVVHRPGQVRGNITSPRVTLEDGARLKGAIDTSSGAEVTAGTEKEGTRPARNEGTKTREKDTAEVRAHHTAGASLQ